MSHRRVKIYVDYDGTKTKYPKWHLVVNEQGSDMAYCTGEVFEFGDHTNVKFSVEEVEKGGITCQNCIEKINLIKSIKL